MRIGNSRNELCRSPNKAQRGDPNDPSVKQTRRISNSAEYFVEYLDQHPMSFVFGEQGGNLQHFGLVEPLLSSQSGRSWNVHYNVA